MSDYPSSQHPQRQWHRGDTGQQTARQLNTRVPTYTNSLAASGRPLRQESLSRRPLGRSPSSASQFGDLVHLSAEEPRRHQYNNDLLNRSGPGGRPLRHQTSNSSDTPSYKTDPDDIDDDYVDKQIVTMDYDSKHGYQRDWDRKALGNFEMDAIDGKQSRLSSRQDMYGDEKALTSADDGDANVKVYPSTPRLLLLSFGLAMIVFTMSLDNTVRDLMLGEAKASLLTAHRSSRQRSPKLQKSSTQSTMSAGMAVPTSSHQQLCNLPLAKSSSISTLSGHISSQS